jgi:hypothetical protein
MKIFKAKGKVILVFHYVILSFVEGPAIRYYKVSLLSGLDSKQMAFLLYFLK